MIKGIKNTTALVECNCNSQDGIEEEEEGVKKIR